MSSNLLISHKIINKKNKAQVTFIKSSNKISKNKILKNLILFNILKNSFDKSKIIVSFHYSFLNDLEKTILKNIFNKLGFDLFFIYPYNYIDNQKNKFTNYNFFFKVFNGNIGIISGIFDTDQKKNELLSIFNENKKLLIINGFYNKKLYDNIYMTQFLLKTDQSKYDSINIIHQQLQKLLMILSLIPFSK